MTDSGDSTNHDLLLYSPPGDRREPPQLPGWLEVARVGTGREARAGSAVLLTRAEDLSDLLETMPSEDGRQRRVPVIALAPDEATGLAAVRDGADDWVREGDSPALLSTVRTCRARVAQRRTSRSGRYEIARELRATRDASLRTVGLLLERRDLETKGHTDRVVALAERLAEHLGLAPEQRQALKWGAYLHDIGKIALPDRILFKPGRLTRGEYALVRQHADIGFEMIENLPFLPSEARKLVRHHHERWDGAGYPDRLAGDEIPLLARLFSMVDVLDALLSRRPYKPAWSRERALAAVRRGAGSDFDPELAVAFLEMLDSRRGMMSTVSG